MRIQGSVEVEVEFGLRHLNQQAHDVVWTSVQHLGFHSAPPFRDPCVQ
jgi:hypothetical protein